MTRLFSLFACTLVPTGPAVPIGDPISARVWRPSHADFVYPEIADESLTHLSDRANFGIALAGGGLRGLTLAQGAIRALKDAGILEHAKYMSVSSGSVWFGVPLYYQTKDDLDTFLGKTLSPAELTPEALVQPENAGSLVNRLPYPFTIYPQANVGFSNALWSMVLEKASEYGLTDWPDLAECLENLCLCYTVFLLPEGNLYHELWADVTGSILMAPFDLTAQDSAYCHASQLERTQQLLGNNITVYASQDLKHKLPYLISQSAIYALGSGTDRDANPLTAFPKENTLMYTGIPLPYGPKELKTEPYYGLGDLYVEPFASSSEAQAPLADGAVSEISVVRQGCNPNMGQLVEWQSSTTSIVSMFQVRPQYIEVAKNDSCAGAALSEIMNEELIFSPLQTDLFSGIPKTHSMPIGDAGVYDDNGHLPLLRRGVNKILIYDSWVHHENEAEEMTYTKAAFGAPSVLYGGNNAPGAPNPLMPEGFLTVFEPTEFQPLWDRIRELKAARKPIVVRQNVTVVDNKHFGIKGGWKAEIIFVISLPIDSFRDALPEATKAKLPSYFPNMDSDELLAKFHLSAISQYASYLTEVAVVDEVRAMLNGDPIPPLPPSPTPPPTPPTPPPAPPTPPPPPTPTPTPPTPPPPTPPTPTPPTPPPSPPTPPPAPPTPTPTPSPPAPTGRCLDQTTQEDCESTVQEERGTCYWCQIAGRIYICTPSSDCNNQTAVV